MDPLRDDHEWNEPDGLGGCASGTASGLRTRRDHALLSATTGSPGRPVVLVNGLEASVTTPAGVFALTSQRYAPDVVHPDGARRVVAFDERPWPTWTCEIEDGTRLVHELFVPHGRPLAALSWRLEPAPGTLTPGPVALDVRLLLSGRDRDALHHENPQFRMRAETVPEFGGGIRMRFQPYAGLPPILVSSNGHYEPAPAWYRNFLYERERERGDGCSEDLASPGILRFLLVHEPAVLLLAAARDALPYAAGPLSAHQALAARERARRAASPAEAVDALLGADSPR